MGNTTQFLILGMLSKEPMTGYDIKKTVKKTNMDSFWDISYGQIYPTLHTLEKEGAITKKVEINQNRPNRKIYSITSQGIKKLQDWLQKPAEPEKVKIETLLKVGFGEQTTKNEVIKHLKEFKKRCNSRLENAIAFENEIKNRPNQTERGFYTLLTVLLGKNFEKAGIDWADTAIKLLNEHIEQK
ncbi:MAG: PadR family transcriptional regulator [Candidatus Bathyarchaeota archaeon]|nr:MAG: PadR family transcriptional regulator [Candidatus Bathyarchaeum tardum]WNZ28420.1 MAG: PadR family transcriptional regulator [Candidatus Bathyarchaeota archaeon]